MAYLGVLSSTKNLKIREKLGLARHVWKHVQQKTHTKKTHKKTSCSLNNPPTSELFSDFLDFF